jgi:hypothetical protein
MTDTPPKHTLSCRHVDVGDVFDGYVIERRIKPIGETIEIDGKMVELLNRRGNKFFAHKEGDNKTVMICVDEIFDSSRLKPYYT